MKSCQNLYNFDLEVKSERRIRIMNVRDTLSHGDRPMVCQCQSKKKLQGGHEATLKRTYKFYLEV